MTSLYPAETNSGVVTSWIPLTTVFTPSASCTSQFRLDGPSLVAFDPGYGLDIDSNAECAPPAVTTWWEQGRLGGGDGNGHTAVSIGPLTCPDEWTTVASSTSQGSSTAFMCCPSGYTLANGVEGVIAGDCLSDVARGLVLTYASTPATESTSWNIVTTTLAQASSVGAIAIVGWDIQASSSASPSPTSSPTSTSHSATPSATSPTHSTSPTTSKAASTSAGLSTGASVGIGVGVALGVIGIVALTAALYLLRRKRGKAAARAELEQPMPPPVPPAQGEQKPWPAHELDPDGLTPELPTHRPPAELYSG